MRSIVRLVAVAGLLLVGQVATAACLAVVPWDEAPVTTKTHHCCSLCLGMRTTDETRVSYHGLTIGLTHSSMPRNDVMRMFANEQCDFNGISLQLLAQINMGTVTGAAVTGLICAQESVYGWQCSGLANDASKIVGVQSAIALNVADEVEGMQIGILNRAGKLKGIQIGLLNVNHSGWVLPLINFSW